MAHRGAKGFLLRRLLQAAVSLIGVSVVVFLLSHAVGNPVEILLPTGADEHAREALTRRLGLDRSLPMQYVMFLRSAIVGDFGYSYYYDVPALALVVQRFPATVEIGVPAMVLAILVGLPIGIASAVYSQSWIDRFGKVAALLGQSLPIFWLGIMLMYVMAVKLRLLPTSGRGGLAHVVLPAVTLSLFAMASIMRITRSSMLEVLGTEYVRMLRAKGVPESVIVWRHALKNAAVSIVTVIGLITGILLSGTVITETIFAWPGIGKIAVDAIFARDYPVVQAVILLTSGVFIVINLAVDMIYIWLDPRIRIG